MWRLRKKREDEQVTGKEKKEEEAEGKEKEISETEQQQETRRQSQEKTQRRQQERKRKEGEPHEPNDIEVHMSKSSAPQCPSHAQTMTARRKTGMMNQNHGRD